MKTVPAAGQQLQSQSVWIDVRNTTKMKARQLGRQTDRRTTLKPQPLDHSTWDIKEGCKKTPTNASTQVFGWGESKVEIPYIIVKRVDPTFDSNSD